VNGVVQESDAAAQDATEDFHDDKAESRSHGPAKDGRSKYGVGVAGVVMIVVMQMTRLTLAVRMRAHRYHSTHSLGAVQSSSLLIRQFDTPLPGMD
jgi:hypothetical protein